MSHRCKDCKKYFSVRIGTPLQNSNLSVRKWLLAIHMLLTDRKGESGLKMHKSANTAYDTSWFLGHRVRRMMEADGLPLLSGTIQVDETYLGGKFKNMHSKTKKEYGGDGMANKIPVIGIRDENGQVVVMQLRNTDPDTLLDFILTHVKPGSTVWSDGQPAYQPLEAFGYEHQTVNHTEKEYVGPSGNTTNGIEGHWSQLKRQYHDTHHYMSPKHAQRYLDESIFRNNAGYGNGPRSIAAVLDQAEGRTLPWRYLTGTDRHKQTA